MADINLTALNNNKLLHYFNNTIELTKYLKALSFKIDKLTLLANNLIFRGKNSLKVIKPFEVQIK